MELLVIEMNRVNFHIASIIAIATCSVLFGVGIVQAGSLSGGVNLNYAEFSAEEDGVEVTDASHFLQQYSLQYGMDGKLGGGRLGAYDLGLGYAWTGLDFEENTQERDFNEGKLLYNGELNFNPRALPMQFSLYSYDRSIPRATMRSLSRIGVREYAYGLPGIYDDVTNGTRIYSGGTFLLGSEDSHYSGPYSSILRSSPMVMADYSDIYVEDLDSFTPEKYRDRRIAFVSLNKRDNWLHYKYFTHKDYFDSTEDYSDKRVILGTIDHMDRRRWINLTNWIQLSADATYAEYTPVGRSLELHKTYDINLFTKLEQPSWVADIPMSFHRHRDGYFSKEAEIPVFLQGAISNSSRWRVRSINEFLETETSGNSFEREIYFTEANLENELRFGKKSQLSFAGEKFIDSNQDSQAFRFEGELSTAYRANALVDWRLAFMSALFSEETPLGDEQFEEYKVSGQYSHRLAQNLNYGLGASVLMGSGVQSSTAVYIRPESKKRQAGDTQYGDGTQTLDGDVYQLVTNLFLEHSTASRIRQRFELTYDYLDRGVKNDIWLLTHALDWNNREHALTMRNRFVTGTHSNPKSDLPLVGGKSSAELDWSFDSTTTYRYRPNISNSLSFESYYDLRSGVLGKEELWRIAQEYTYSSYVAYRNGRRVLWSVGQELEYEANKFENSGDIEATTFQLMGDYFPTPISSLRARFAYQSLQPEDTDSFGYGVSGGLKFTKFSVNLRYDYGVRSGGTFLERNESRWEANVSKVF